MDSVDPPQALEAEVATSAETSLGPRDRLKRLCLTHPSYRNAEQQQWLSEVLQLAQTNPEAFLEDIIDESSNIYYVKVNRRSALNRIISKMILPVQAFETILSVSAPGVLESLDECGDTVLIAFLSVYPYFKDDEEENDYKQWFDLLKVMIGKSKTQLTIADRYGENPIMLAARKECAQEVLQFMIDNYPGDPFQQKTHSDKTLLSVVVANAGSNRYSLDFIRYNAGSNRYSLDFIRYILEQWPEAVAIQETDKYESSVFHSACCSDREDVLRLLLNKYPQGASNIARYGRTPLHSLLDVYILRLNDEKKSMIELVSLANPKAIFSNMHHHKEWWNTARCPFSALSTTLLSRLSGETADSLPYRDLSDEEIWSVLYFLMSVFRYSKNAENKDPWNPPSHPVHMAASCPCPSKFLLHVATSNPKQLLNYDNERRSVLALALESGHSVGGCYKYREGVIQEIVKIDERTIGLPDVRTGLYPFMTAAHSEGKISEMGILDNFWAREKGDFAKTKVQEMVDATPLICLNTIYFLLRADPSRVSPGIVEGKCTVQKRPASDIS